MWANSSMPFWTSSAFRRSTVSVAPCALGSGTRSASAGSLVFTALPLEKGAQIGVELQEAPEVRLGTESGIQRLLIGLHLCPRDWFGARALVRAPNPKTAETLPDASLHVTTVLRL